MKASYWSKVTIKASDWSLIIINAFDWLPGDAPSVAAVQLVEHISEVAAEVSRQLTASADLLCTGALESSEVSGQGRVEMSARLCVVVGH